MTCLRLKRHVLMMSAAHAVLVVTVAVMVVQVAIVVHHPVVALAALSVPTPRLPMAATNLLRHLVPTPTPPLSAFAKSPRQLQLLTVKENNYVATRSSQIPQRAKRP
jgi:hypothetical protein